MSKIGEAPISIPEGTEVSINNDTVEVKGREGLLQLDIPKVLEVKVNDGLVKIARKSNDRRSKALHGLGRSIVYNAIAGVNKLWEKRLEVIGTGYRVKLQGENLTFEIGYSHPVTFEKISGISFSIEDKNVIAVKGIDKQLVGQVAHRVKMIRRPDPYKGKGIRYQGEQIKLKPGKKAKAATGA